MDGVRHTTVRLNGGLNMRVAEAGTGPVVLLLHGFPELWYTWRHQMRALAAQGYRAVAPDLRGFAGTDSPSDVSAYSCLHVVGDIVGLIRSLGDDGIFLVAHDWGAMIGWYLCLFRPDLVKAYVALTVPFRPRHPEVKPVQGLRAVFGEDYYMCRFQEPGKIEQEIAKVGSELVIRKVLTSRTPAPPRLKAEDPFGSGSEPGEIELPAWLTEEDIKYYARNYDDKGFTGGLNYYRALDLNWELTAAWDGAKVRVPVKFVVGDLDMVYNTPGVKEYVHGGEFKNDVPLLEECVVIHDAGHFINQERPEEINALILDFINKF